jgi:diamine N-acetyltransferase
MPPLPSIAFRQLTPHEFHLIRPLWEQLNQQHAAYSTPFAAEITSRSFVERLRTLREKANGERLRIEIASTVPDGPPVAYCITTLSSTGGGEVDSLFVSAEHRRHGIATALMQSALNWLQASGASSQHVVVFHANTEAIAFYQRFGFHPRNVMLERINPAN